MAETTKDAVCCACGNRFEGGAKFVFALEKNWHHACFACAACNQPLTDFVVLEGKAYCTKHAEEKQQAEYVASCKRCDECNTPLTGLFFVRDGKNFCSAHRKPASKGPPCAACGLAIDGPATLAQDRRFHMDCFRCVRCERPLGTGEPYYDVEGDPYCEKHYRAAFCQTCDGCGRTIEGDHVSALDMHFHTHCIFCVRCSAPILPGAKFAVVDGKFVCEPCNADTHAPPPTAPVPAVPVTIDSPAPPEDDDDEDSDDESAPPVALPNEEKEQPMTLERMLKLMDLDVDPSAVIDGSRARNMDSDDEEDEDGPTGPISLPGLMSLLDVGESNSKSARSSTEESSTATPPLPMESHYASLSFPTEQRKKSADRPTNLQNIEEEPTEYAIPMHRRPSLASSDPDLVRRRSVSMPNLPLDRQRAEGQKEPPPKSPLGPTSDRSQLSPRAKDGSPKDFRERAKSANQRPKVTSRLSGWFQRLVRSDAAADASPQAAPSPASTAPPPGALKRELSQSADAINEDLASLSPAPSPKVPSPQRSPKAAARDSLRSFLGGRILPRGAAPPRDPEPRRRSSKVAMDGTLYQRSKEGEFVIIGGTPEKLVEKVAAGDTQYANVFVLTFRHAISPVEMMRLIATRFDIVDPDANPAAWSNNHAASQQRMVEFLAEWISLYPMDFVTGSDVRAVLNDMLDTLAANGLDGVAARIRRTIADCVVSRQSFSLEAQRKASISIGLKRKTEFVELNPTKLASELTLQELEWLQRVRPTEVLIQLWCDEKDPVVAEAKGALTAYIQWFNTVSSWVSTQVVTTDDLRRRAQTVERFIKIAKVLKRLRNFNTLYAVVLGLHHGAVERMKKTWELVSRRRLAALREIESILDPDHNFENYRKAFKSCAPPAIPVLCIMLKDLTSLNELPKRFKNAYVNFRKLRLIADRIDEFRRFQGSEYRSLSVDSRTHRYCENLEKLADRELFRCSKYLEPRTAASAAPREAGSGGGVSFAPTPTPAAATSSGQSTPSSTSPVATLVTAGLVRGVVHQPLATVASVNMEEQKGTFGRAAMRRVAMELALVPDESS